jgi:hypothetical protein
MDDVDLSFLDVLSSDSQIDAFVQDMFRITILRLCNDLPDVGLHTISNPIQLDEFVSGLFANPLEVVQIIVPNTHETAERCPYFRILLYNWKPTREVNYTLDAFFKAAGVTNVSPRCQDAVVVGMDPKRCDAQTTNVSIPSHFCMTGVENISFLGDVQINNLPSSCKVLDQFRGTMIEGCMPCHLHWKIFQYLEHPTASIMKNYANFHLLYFDGFTSTYWDLHFRALVRRHGMFLPQLRTINTYSSSL